MKITKIKKHLFDFLAKAKCVLLVCWREIKKFLLLAWPFAASAAMLTVIQPPLGFWPLAWIAYVPLILISSPNARPKHLALTAYPIALVYWLANLYWIQPVTTAGWAAFCLYTALLWPILALALRYCRTKKIPLLLAVPVLIVGAERLQGLFLGGFPWRFLAHSQYQNIALIQIADIFGAPGISFLIAAVNALIAEFAILAAYKRRRQSPIGPLTPPARLPLKTVLVAAALAATFVYGNWRIAQTEEFVETGPLVASLQSNVPQSVKRTGQASEEIFADLMISSKAAVAASPQLIVWPETMVQAILDKEIWPLLVSSDNNRAFDKALAEHAKDNAFLLIGAYGAEIKRTNSDSRLARYNAAFLYTRHGWQKPQRYDKIHLVPFGEVIPFKTSQPWLYNILMKFTPYDYDYSLDYGDKYTVFNITDATPRREQLYRFGVLICYEGTIPSIARTFAKADGKKKQVDWLLNISNDGWFVRFNDAGKVFPTTELAQHAATCTFRAVENRVAILRSVNTGISCLIDTLGRIRNGYVAGNLPERAMERQGMAGWFVAEMPIDKRVTFFSKYGQWLDSCCAVALFSVIILPTLARLIRKRKHKTGSLRQAK